MSGRGDELPAALVFFVEGNSYYSYYSYYSYCS